MTSITLLQWILGVLLLQVAALMALAFVRHWQAYTALRTAAIWLAMSRQGWPSSIIRWIPRS